jgi:hypothetical protein
LSKNHGGIGGEEELSRCNNGGEQEVEEAVQKGDKKRLK